MIILRRYCDEFSAVRDPKVKAHNPKGKNLRLVQPIRGKVVLDTKMGGCYFECGKLNFLSKSRRKLDNKWRYFLSHWENYSFLQRILIILPNLPCCEASGHLGNAFLSSYQLAFEFDRLYHDDVLEMNLQIGGEGIGEHRSLTQAIAHGLSQEVRKEDTEIEGGFFPTTQLKPFLLTFPTLEIKPTTSNLSIWRRRRQQQ